MTYIFIKLKMQASVQVDFTSRPIETSQMLEDRQKTDQNQSKEALLHKIDFKIAFVRLHITYSKAFASLKYR